MINNPTYPQIQDETVVLGRAAVINFAGAGVTASIVGNVATVTIPGGGAGGLTLGAFTANMPAGSMIQVFQVIDAAILGGSRILLANGLYADTDENDPDDINFKVLSVAVGSFFFRIIAINPVSGPFKFFYAIG